VSAPSDPWRSFIEETLEWKNPHLLGSRSGWWRQMPGTPRESAATFDDRFCAQLLSGQMLLDKTG
jgi:hypothetical protein